MVTEKEIDEMIEKFDTKKHNAIINNDKDTAGECQKILNVLYWALGRTTTIFI